MDVKYLRFGEIPKDMRSVNYFKLSYEQQDTLKYEDYPNEAKEIGLSVFELVDNKPLLNNLQLITTLHSRIKDNYKAYVVTGTEVGRGNDGEPLLINVEIIEEYQYCKEVMYKYIISTLTEKYKYNKETDIDDEYIGKFYYPDEKLVCNGIEFRNPVEGFDDRLGYKER